VATWALNFTARELFIALHMLLAVWTRKLEVTHKLVSGLPQHASIRPALQPSTSPHPPS